MSVPAELVAPVQRAAAYVAARSRGDYEGAELLLGDFRSDPERLVAFCILAQLALRLLAAQDGRPVDAVASALATQIAQAAAP